MLKIFRLQHMNDNTEFFSVCFQKITMASHLNRTGVFSKQSRKAKGLLLWWVQLAGLELANPGVCGIYIYGAFSARRKVGGDTVGAAALAS